MREHKIIEHGLCGLYGHKVREYGLCSLCEHKFIQNRGYVVSVSIYGAWFVYFVHEVIDTCVVCVNIVIETRVV